MLRSAGIALAWLGLSAMTMGLSLSACFVDITEGKTGNCEDDGNPCTNDTCAGGTPQHTAAPGIECSLNNNAGTCNDKGRCVTVCETDPTKCRCNVDTQCPPKEDCGEWKCNVGSGQCERMPINENLATPKQITGDCITVICKNGEYFDQPESMDAPPTKGDCVNYECSNGAPLPKAADVGSSCSTGTCTAPNVCCSSANLCVDCLSAVDWAACGGDSCPVKKCDGETTLNSTECKSGFAADGVCCDSACTDVCKSCNIMGSIGQCSNVAYLEQELTGCNVAMAGGVCDGTGQCLKVSGRPCQEDANCLSGKCSQALKCLGAPGEFCTLATDCASGTCMMGACT
jgi:hypothetical protein